jgi:putative FmdB family regulatory protein
LQDESFLRETGSYEVTRLAEDGARRTQVPLYEYRCPECGSRFEVLQRVGQGPEGLACPSCGKTGVEKEYSTFAGSAAGGAGLGGGGCAPSGRFT